MNTAEDTLCYKCEWHKEREGYSWNYRNGTETHGIQIDVCIHPVLDDLNKIDHNGNKQYHVVKCITRNPDLNCLHYQPKRSFFIQIVDLFRGKKWIDVYNRYNNIK